MEKFWIRLNRVNLERRVLTGYNKELQDDNLKLKFALCSFMGGMNPENQDLKTFADELMVIPGSPIPFYPHSSASPSLDSDDTTTNRKSSIKIK